MKPEENMEQPLLGDHICPSPISPRVRRKPILDIIISPDFPQFLLLFRSGDSKGEKRNKRSSLYNVAEESKVPGREKIFQCGSTTQRPRPLRR
ncbi:hypothetical protein JZ751_008919 [Albula glossodonta]|uniref:Uncharacterized protein n=1 Tax=Albula glossodonta TaxID=121402 RepID=A0A8T2P018_9TELE|nr:hypothetical protein JZ751_008919 [Albula glossodonta]